MRLRVRKKLEVSEIGHGLLELWQRAALNISSYYASTRETLERGDDMLQAVYASFWI